MLLLASVPVVAPANLTSLARIAESTSLPVMSCCGASSAAASAWPTVAPLGALPGSRLKQPQQSRNVSARATRQFEVVALRSRKRRRARRGTDSGGSSGEDDDFFELSFGGGGSNNGGSSNSGGGSSWGSNGGFGGLGGGGGGGGIPRRGMYSEGFNAWHRMLLESAWFWQVMSGATLLQALHFMVCGEAQKAVATGGASAVAATASMVAAAAAAAAASSASADMPGGPAAPSVAA